MTTNYMLKLKMILIITQLFVLSQQFDFNYTDNYDDNLILIQSESVGITIFKGASSFQLYAMQNKSYAIYNSSLESEFHLTYDDAFKINNKAPKTIESKGSIVLPPFLKMFLANHEPCLSPVEPIEVCLDFATERLSLKVIAGILGLVLIFTNFKDVRKAYINTKHNYPEMKINTLPFQKLFSWNKLPTSAAESVV